MGDLIKSEILRADREDGNAMVLLRIVGVHEQAPH